MLNIRRNIHVNRESARWKGFIRHFHLVTFSAEQKAQHLCPRNGAEDVDSLRLVRQLEVVHPQRLFVRHRGQRLTSVHQGGRKEAGDIEPSARNPSSRSGVFQQDFNDMFWKHIQLWDIFCSYQLLYDQSF